MELPIEAHRRTVVGTLAPGVTHELNNHVNNIALTADLLLEDYSELPDEERLDMVNDIVKESEKAKIVVQNLSSFVGENETGFQTHDIPGIIDDALRLAGKHIKRSKAKIMGELTPNLPRIRCIRVEIEHAFLNILLNALEAMAEGGTITISCDIARDGDFVSVEFTDTGSGIPKEIISEIFMPSFTTKPRKRALGLGLAICLQIVKKHGGDIQVKSQVGKGATFIILLPTFESS